MGVETAFIAGLALTAIGTGATIYSQQQQADTAERAAKYNAGLAEQEAANAELEFVEASKRQRQRDRRQMATLRNRLANTGSLTTSGTPLAILGESEANMNLAIQDASRATAMQASSLRAQGQMGLWEAGQIRKATNLSSLATGINGAAGMFGSYQTAQQQGVFRRKNTA